MTKAQNKSWWITTTIFDIASDVKVFSPPEKRPKIILNSEEIKNLIEKKDEELRKQEEAARY